VAADETQMGRAVESGDIAALRRLQAEHAAVNNAKQIPAAWGGILGLTSAGADLSGYLEEYLFGC
jgi:hypothetical protein